MKNLLASLIILAISGSVIAQPDLTIYHMDQLPQSWNYNLSQMPLSRTYVGIPVLGSVYVQAGNSGFSFVNALEFRDDNTYVVSLNNMVNSMNKRNYATSHFSMDLLNFGIKTSHNSYFSIGATEKGSVRFTYPKQLFEILVNGNSDKKDTRASFDAIGINASHYREYYLGHTRTINDNLSFGFRVKYLYGMENIYTKRSRIGITTESEEFDITIDGGFEIMTSGLPFSDDFEFNASNYVMSGKNKGFALDAGVRYKIERFDISLNIIDAGFIKWNDNIHNFKLDNVSHTFSGIDYNNISMYDGIDMMDTLKIMFPVQESHEAYTTTLNLHSFLGASTEITNRSKIGLLIHSEFIQGFPKTDISLSYHTRLRRALYLSGSYNIINSTFANFGLGLSTGGPVQFYILTDNVLGIVMPDRSRHTSARFGFNLAFGRNYSTKGANIEDPIPL